MRIDGTNISMVRGDTESLIVEIFDGRNLDRFNEGDTLYFTVKDNINTTENSVTISFANAPKLEEYVVTVIG